VKLLLKKLSISLKGNNFYKCLQILKPDLDFWIDTLKW